MTPLPNETRLQDQDIPNLIWITEAKGGRMVTRTEQTTETVTNTETNNVNDNEVIITETITRVTVKKNNLQVVNNNTNV